MSKKEKKELKAANLAVKFKTDVEVPRGFVAAVFSEAEVQFMGSQKKFQKLLKNDEHIVKTLTYLYTAIYFFQSPGTDLEKEAVLINTDSERFFLNPLVSENAGVQTVLVALRKYVIGLGGGFVDFPMSVDTVKNDAPETGIMYTDK